MPTQEERLTTLEKAFATFRQETGTHIKETEENTTIMLGVMRSQGQDIRKIFQRLETMDESLNGIEQRFDRLETKFDEHTTLLNEHARVLGEHTVLLNEHTRVLNEHTARFDHLETLLTQILARLPEKP